MLPLANFLLQVCKTILGGPCVNLFTQTSLWCFCFNLLGPPCGLVASIHLNLFVAFLVDPP